MGVWDKFMMLVHQCKYCNIYYEVGSMHDCKLSNYNLLEEIEKLKKQIFELKQEIEQIKFPLS